MKSLLLAILLIPVIALADSVNNATISNISVASNGVVSILFSPAMTGGPSCATQTQWLVFDSTTPGGTAMMRALMLNFALGKTVYMTGTGTCTIYGNTENLASIENSD